LASIFDTTKLVLIQEFDHVTKIPLLQKFKVKRARGDCTIGGKVHNGENWGDFVMIMMLLLVSIIIYYFRLLTCYIDVT